PAKRHLTAEKRKRLRLETAVAAAAVGVSIGIAYAFHAGGVWSRWTAQDWLLAKVQNALDYIQNPSTFIFHITSPVGDFLVQRGLEPLRSFLVELPWPVTIVGLVLIAFLLSGLRPRCSRSSASSPRG